jgi:hypothetical protein
MYENICIITVAGAVKLSRKCSLPVKRYQAVRRVEKVYILYYTNAPQCTCIHCFLFTNLYNYVVTLSTRYMLIVLL